MGDERAQMAFVDSLSGLDAAATAERSSEAATLHAIFELLESYTREGGLSLVCSD